MDDETSERELALRKLPLIYSLALRLRDAGVAPEVISEYVGIDEVALCGVFRIAEAKLLAARSLARTRGQGPVEGTPHRYVPCLGEQFE